MAERVSVYRADWYVRKGGRAEKIGPFSLATLSRMWEQGNVVSRDLLFAQGVLPEWVRAGRLQYLFVPDAFEENLLQEPAATVESADSKSSPPTSLTADVATPLFDTDSTTAIAPASPFSDQPDILRDANGLYLRSRDHLRGPVSLQQLEMLLAWNEVELSTEVFDFEGEPINTVSNVLGVSKVPVRRTVVQPEISKPQPTRPSNARAKQRSSGPTPELQEIYELQPVSLDSLEIPSRPLPPRRSDEASTHTANPAPKTPQKERRLDLAADEFNALLNEAAKEERGAESSARPTYPKRQLRPAREHKQVDDADPGVENALQETPESAEFKRAVRRLVRSPAYSRTCTLWSVVYLVYSVVFLTASNALFAGFLRRMGGLCLSTFIPFGATPEELQGDALLMAGFATFLVGVFLAYQLWHLLRTDCIPWHSVTAMVLGVFLGLGLRSELFASIFRFMQMFAAICGMTLIIIGLGLINSIRHNRLAVFALVATFATALGAAGLFICSSQVTFALNLQALPPTIEGAAPFSVVFIVMTLFVTGSYPVFTYYVMSHQASRPVKEFMDTHLLTALACAVVALLSSYWMISPDPNEFMSIPFALLPLAATNAIVGMVPPVMYLTSPYNAGIQ